MSTLTICSTDYVEDIYQTFVETMQNDTELEKAQKELKEMTPAAMNTMLEKQPRTEAIDKRKARKSMTVADVPPTNPGESVLIIKAKAHSSPSPGQPHHRM